MVSISSARTTAAPASAATVASGSRNQRGRDIRSSLKHHVNLANDLADVNESTLAVARIEAHLVRSLDVEVTRGNDARRERLQAMAIQGVALGDADVGAIDEHVAILDAHAVPGHAHNAFEEALPLLQMHEFLPVEAVDDQVTACERGRRVQPDHGVGEASGPVEEEVVLRHAPGEHQRQVNVPALTKVRPQRALVRTATGNPRLE